MNRYTALFFFLLTIISHAQKADATLEYGFEQRVRNEDWNNIFDYNGAANDERGQVRYRTRLWMKAPLGSNVDFSLGLAQETNQIFNPRTPTHFDEVIFETAYFDIKKLFHTGLSLKVGRQNLMKGEGFLFMEGDPYDGSRTIYSNAAVLGYEKGKSKLEIMAISNPHADRYLPIINNRHRGLVEWDEVALGAYYTGNQRKDTTLEAYDSYKREYGDRRPASNPQFHPNRYLYTAGGRVLHKLPSAFSVTGEFAGQWGRRHPDVDIRAWGGYGYLKRTFGPQNRHNASFGYWAMSGDNPATRGTIENWDPLFSRWPKWSELYLYSLFRENGVGYWTNLGMWQGESVYVPWKPLSIRGAIYHMTAFHAFPGNPQLFSGGTTRGNLYEVRADLVVNRNWRGHAMYEAVSPGDFYTGHSRGHFIRLEIIYTFTGKVAL